MQPRGSEASGGVRPYLTLVSYPDHQVYWDYSPCAHVFMSHMKLHPMSRETNVAPIAFVTHSHVTYFSVSYTYILGTKADTTALYSRLGPYPQYHRYANNLFHHLPKSQVRLFRGDWASDWRRRAPCSCQQARKHSDGCYDWLFWGCRMHCRIPNGPSVM